VAAPGSLFVVGPDGEGQVFEIGTTGLLERDRFQLPNAAGINSVFVRNGVFHYTTPERAVQYDLATEMVLFDYHEFWQKFSAVVPVIATDLRTYDDYSGGVWPNVEDVAVDDAFIQHIQHPNIDLNPRITDEMLVEWDRRRLGALRSRELRYNPQANDAYAMPEQLGERYGSAAPGDAAIASHWPKRLLVSFWGRLIASDPDTGMISWDGPEAIRILFSEQKSDRAPDTAFGHVRWPNGVGRILAPNGFPAIELNGVDQYGVAALPKRLWLYGAVTVSVWFKPLTKAGVSSSLYHRIVSTKTEWNGPDGFDLECSVQSPGHPFATVFGQGGSGSRWARGYNGAFEDGAWHHVAAVLGNTTVTSTVPPHTIHGKVFIDGIDRTSGQVRAGPLIPGQQDLFIGKVAGAEAGTAAADHYRGGLADLRIFPAPLRPADIAALYAKGIGG
jgi:hypothetical protein